MDRQLILASYMYMYVHCAFTYSAHGARPWWRILQGYRPIIELQMAVSLPSSGWPAGRVTWLLPTHLPAARELQCQWRY